jgi:ketosteroid isomerase-like protein
MICFNKRFYFELNISAMKFIISCTILSLLSFGANAQFKEETAIRAILNKQTIDWNAGDLEQFMKSYWQSDSLKFIGKSGLTYGWTSTLNNYKKNYPDIAAMGKLDFSIIEINKLSKHYYFVIGKWHLARSAGDLSGHFSLLFKKINNKWLIIADHSS